MRVIKLTQGKFALVDNADFEWLNQWKWYAAIDKTHHTHYALTRKSKVINGFDPPKLRMHRLILKVKNPKVPIDHRNRNGLDNQRHNLRICKHGENTRNCRRREGGSSKFKGVCALIKRGKWRAEIMYNLKSFYLGEFDSETKAAKAYDKKAIQLHGEFANLNFPASKKAVA